MFDGIFWSGGTLAYCSSSDNAMLTDYGFVTVVLEAVISCGGTCFGVHWRYITICWWMRSLVVQGWGSGKKVVILRLEQTAHAFCGLFGVCFRNYYYCSNINRQSLSNIFILRECRVRALVTCGRGKH
jgi:hypothetical protein